MLNFPDNLTWNKVFDQQLSVGMNIERLEEKNVGKKGFLILSCLIQALRIYT